MGALLLQSVPKLFLGLLHRIQIFLLAVCWLQILSWGFMEAQPCSRAAGLQGFRHSAHCPANNWPSTGVCPHFFMGTPFSFKGSLHLLLNYPNNLFRFPVEVLPSSGHKVPFYFLFFWHKVTCFKLLGCSYQLVTSVCLNTWTTWAPLESCLWKIAPLVPHGWQRWQCTRIEGHPPFFWTPFVYCAPKFYRAEQVYCHRLECWTGSGPVIWQWSYSLLLACPPFLPEFCAFLPHGLC